MPAWMDAGVLTTRWDYAWKMVRGSVGGVQKTVRAYATTKALAQEKLAAQ